MLLQPFLCISCRTKAARTKLTGVRFTSCRLERLFSVRALSSTVVWLFIHLHVCLFVWWKIVFTSLLREINFGWNFPILNPAEHVIEHCDSGGKKISTNGPNGIPNCMTLLNAARTERDTFCNSHLNWIEWNIFYSWIFAQQEVKNRNILMKHIKWFNEIAQEFE